MNEASSPDAPREEASPDAPGASVSPGASAHATASAPAAYSPRPWNWVRITSVVCGVLLLAIVLRIVTLPQFRWIVSGLDGLLPLVIGVLVAAIALFAFVAFAPLSARLRLGVLCGAIALLVVIPGVVRVEYFRGDMTPVLAWRWSPNAKDRWRDFVAADAHDGPRGTGASGVVAPIAVEIQPSDMPGFRGVDRRGVIRDAALDIDWTNHPPVELWRHPVGLGWSSFATAGEAIFTQEQRDAEEVVVCYELATGHQRWVHADRTRYEHATGGDGPRATPTVADGRVFSVGGTGIFNCLDATTGACLWRHVLYPRSDDVPTFGYSCSPLIWKDLVIVSAGPAAGQSLHAYRIADGSLAWSAGDDRAGYSSPILARIAGREQIVIFNGPGLAAHDPATGEVLWQFPWVTQGEQMVNVAIPIVLADHGLPDEGKIFISSGYDRGCALVQVTAAGDTWTAQELWRKSTLKSKFGNLVVHDGHVFGLHDKILVAMDLNTGAIAWKNGRYGHGQMLLVGDLILMQAESGEVALIAADSTSYRELARFAALPERTWNSPVLVGDLMLVRNDQEAACFRVPLKTK